MEKSGTRTHDNIHPVRDAASRKPIVEINRLSSEVNREKSEICVAAKEKTPDLNSQQNIRGNFADLMKFGSVYGSVPPQYFDQFPGLPMQHSLYVGAMFPPMALPPEAHFSYYPYVYPPPTFALGGPHVYAEPITTSSGKRERTSVESDRKEYRDTESETRERNESSSKKDGTPKTWRTEPETMRKESVIKSVSKETVENGKTLVEPSQRVNRETRTNIDQRSVKLDYQRKDDVEGMVSNNTGKFSIGRTEERPSRVSPPTLSRGRDVTNRRLESSHQAFLPSSGLRGKTIDNPHYTNGSPGYSYMSPRKQYDSASSYRSQLYGDKKMHDLDSAKRGYWDTSKDDLRTKKNGEDKVSELRSNGVKDSSEKGRDFEETRSKNESPHEEFVYMKYLKRSDGRFYDDREDKRLRYSEELINRRARREQARKHERRREETGRERSPPEVHTNMHDVHHITSMSHFPVTTSHSVETIMNGRPSGSPAKPSERLKEETRTRSDWSTQREVAASDRITEIDEQKRVDIANSRDSLSREQRMRDSVARGQQTRDDESRGLQFFDPRLRNPGMADPRGIDSRLFPPNDNPRYQSEPRGFDPRKFEQHFREIRESMDVNKKRNLDDKSEEKHRNIDRPSERIFRRNDSSADPSLPEPLRVFDNDNGRPRSAPQSSTRSGSPRVNGVDVKQTRTERETQSRGVDTSSEVKEGTETKRNDSIGQPMPSRQRSSPKDDDVIVSKNNSSVGPNHTINVSRPGAETSVSNTMRAGFGNLVMTPAGTGYPNLPMLNSDAYFQQLVLAQREGRLPMFFPMPNGMFPPAMDPNQAAMLSKELMMKAWNELFQGIVSPG